MADSIVNPALRVSQDFHPGVTAAETDLTVAAATTTNSAIKDLGFACHAVRAVVHLDTLAGSSTLNVKLQASSSATFASDIVELDSKFINAVVASNTTMALSLFGVDVSAAGRRYVRVSFVTGTGTSAVADIEYAAAQ